MLSVDELRARLEAIVSERRAMDEAAGEEALSTPQQEVWDALDTEETDVRSKLAIAEETEARAARVVESRAKWNSTQVSVVPDTFDVLRHNGYGVSRQALMDAALRATDKRIGDTEHFRKIFARHSGDPQWAANIIGRARPEYATGFAKIMRGEAMLLSSEERAAMAVGTNTAGGYLVPTHLDATLILTNAGTSNAIRGISRVVTLGNENVWHGITTAGVTASWDGELVEVSDDSPAVGPVTIPTYKAQALIQASIESFEDIAGLESDAMMLLADAKDRLEGIAHATGPGSTAPKGVFTAVGAVAGSKITSTTAATIGLVDIHALYSGLPVRHRATSSWCMNPLFNMAIKSLGSTLGASYSTDITQGPAGAYLGRPVYESDDAPSTVTTTALDQEVILGDFQKYVIVDKPGSMAVEFIPHLFNTTTNLPDGRRGWYLHWRNGADVTDANAFRMLVDKTSA